MNIARTKGEANFNKKGDDANNKALTKFGCIPGNKPAIVPKIKPKKIDMNISNNILVNFNFFCFYF